ALMINGKPDGINSAPIPLIAPPLIAPPLIAPKGLARILRTTTFRLALIYLVLFLASVGIVLGYVYWRTAVLLDTQTDETIEAEVQGLAEQYRSGGIDVLIRTLNARSRDEGSSVYLLVDSKGNRLAGNLAGNPKGRQTRPGWLEFDYRVKDQDEVMLHSARARLFRLVGDLRLLVGRDIEALHRFDITMRTAIAWALGITLILGLAGGILVSRHVLARIEAITRTSHTIMSGDLSGRVALTGSGDELDRLAQNLNRMLEEIERLMGATREVTDNIAHDLRTPLTRLRARLEDALRSRAGPADREALSTNLEEIDRLIATFNALLSIARLEAGSGHEELAVIDLAPSIRDAVELYQPLAEEEGFEVRIDVADGLEARADRQLIGQAVANLVDNAMKYGRAEDGPSRITISAAKIGEEIRISVADTGPGVSPADQERVLGRMVRLEASRSAPGSGLGLSLVAAIAHHHGARLDLTDANPDLCATLSLPYVDEAA
ncbi:MAG: ATP-binding protein, partial [Hyphomicrobiales bacterium]